MIRLGLCCIFREVPIRFRQTTAAALIKIPRDEQMGKLSSLCLGNMMSLSKALRWAAGNGVGSFRILSPIFPRMTHPDVGYMLEDLPDCERILSECERIRIRREQDDIRLTMHPDQFNVLSSPHENVITNTLAELENQGLVAELVGADVINIHGGGIYGDKNKALQRLCNNFSLLSERVRSRLTLENDDKSYTPANLIPICEKLGIPFVYDVHHHRCLGDGLTINEATLMSLKTWESLQREPLFHISSPLNGYDSSKPQPHADFIEISDFPVEWLDLDLTVEVEAKAKELAVIKLKKELETLVN